MSKKIAAVVPVEITVLLLRLGCVCFSLHDA